MSGPDNLYLLGQRLGLAAVTASTKFTQLTDHLRIHGDTPGEKFERDARLEWDKFTALAIAFTARFMVVCGAGSRKKARELERKLVGQMKMLQSSEEDFAEFKPAIESLAATAREFAVKMALLVEKAVLAGGDPGHLGRSPEAREPMYWLSRAAITFTGQLILACSTDKQATRDRIDELERVLFAHLDNAPWYGTDK